MRYLITTPEHEPFRTEFFDPENHLTRTACHRFGFFISLSPTYDTFTFVSRKIKRHVTQSLYLKIRPGTPKGAHPAGLVGLGAIRGIFVFQGYKCKLPDISENKFLVRCCGFQKAAWRGQKQGNERKGKEIVQVHTGLERRKATR